MLRVNLQPNKRIYDLLISHVIPIFEGLLPNRAFLENNSSKITINKEQKVTKMLKTYANSAIIKYNTYTSTKQAIINLKAF
jgi:hypothetical protein